MTKEREMFDESALYHEVVRVWGEYGAHAEVMRYLMAASAGRAELVEALRDLTGTAAGAVELDDWPELQASLANARAALAKAGA